MSEEPDAIERLERRVAVLEDAVRRLIALRTGADILQPAPRPRPLARAESTTPTPWAPAPPAAERPTQDLEQWFGQRALLVVGVLALLAAAAFFLKYAFDRNWIQPLVRSLLAIAAGAGVAVWGHERIKSGMRRYGAGLIGAGAGLVYLGVWAAAGPYALVDRRVGVLLLAASTVVVTTLALHHEIEHLALWALAGAYLAPALLPPPVPNQMAFLGYLEVVGIGTGVLAYTQGWRRTFDVALFGYLALAASGAGEALRTPVGCWFIATAAVLTLHVTRRHAWPEARLGVVLVAWLMLATSVDLQPTGTQAAVWLGLGAPFAVAALLWWQHLAPDPFTPPAKGGETAVDQLLFLIAPFALILLAGVAEPQLLQGRPGALPVVLGAAYVAVGWTRRTASLLIMGFVLIALASALQWSTTATAVAWTGLALAALAADRWADRPGARTVALGLAVFAGFDLLLVAVWSRHASAPVFWDAWALALYAYLVATAWAARAWRVPATPANWEQSGAQAFWVMCGVATLIGGSIQLNAFFGPGTLAGNLALSVWWLVFAGAVVQLGFRLNHKDVRSAGLLVAAAAALKIVLYDLSTLQALYRVAVFFALALIALAVAYAYNRRAKT